MSAIAVALGCLLISIVWNIFFWDRSYGISMPVFAALVIAFLLWLKRTSLSKAKLTLSIHIFIIAYLSICVVCYRNSLILYAAIPSTLLGLATMVFVGRQSYSFSNCVGVLEYLLKTIFCAIFAAPNTIGQAFNKLTGTGKASRSAVKVFIGILFSLPFLILFTWLFTSADPIFEKYLKKLFDFIWQPELLTRATVIIFMWFLFCGYLTRSSKHSSLDSYLNRTKTKPRRYHRFCLSANEQPAFPLIYYHSTRIPLRWRTGN